MTTLDLGICTGLLFCLSILMIFGCNFMQREQKDQFYKSLLFTATAVWKMVALMSLIIMSLAIFDR